LLANAIAKSDHELKADVFSCVGVYFQGVKQACANGCEACPNEKVYLVDAKLGENNPTEDDKQSCPEVGL
jgi:hypothetical protein